jgi:hypothetical protein
MRSSTFFPCGFKKLGEALHAMTGKLSGIGQFENLGRTVEDALRVPLAQVAFYGQTIDGIQDYCPDRAGVHAHGTADTEILLNHDHSFGLGSVHGPAGADVQTGWILTV